VMKAGIEERKRFYERDARLATAVPSALVTYRQLTSTYPNAKGAEIALEKLAKLYEDLERFDLAAATFAELATRHPSLSPDAWYRAGELYRRRLNDSQLARNAYSSVPKESRYYKDAQNRLR
jgi:TolA-binding protein